MEHGEWMMSHSPRFPLDRLVPFSDGVPMRELLMSAGLPHSTAYRALRAGSLSSLSADRVAVGLGRHPAEIWGWSAWWTSAADEPTCWCGAPARWSPAGERARPSCCDDHAQAARRQADAERNRRRRAAVAAA